MKINFINKNLAIRLGYAGWQVHVNKFFWLHKTKTLKHQLNFSRDFDQKWNILLVFCCSYIFREIMALCNIYQHNRNSGFSVLVFFLFNYRCIKLIWRYFHYCWHKLCNVIIFVSFRMQSRDTRKDWQNSKRMTAQTPIDLLNLTYCVWKFDLYMYLRQL